jgi:hypothetical protein
MPRAPEKPYRHDAFAVTIDRRQAAEPALAEAAAA